MAGDSSSINYHLSELRIARDPHSPHHVMPSLRAGERRILDIGCGVGQTLVALDADARCELTGIDIDIGALAYGRRNFPKVAYAQASAEALPFADRSFDLVISRVALPYTVLEHSVAEMVRVLDARGRIWLTLHSTSKVWAHFRQAVRGIAVRDCVFQSYVLLNGMIFHFLSKQCRFPFNGKCESFQTRAGMTRLLQQCGMNDIEFESGPHFLCTARK